MFLLLLLLWVIQIPTPTSENPQLLETLVSARFETANPRPLTGQAFTLELIVSLPPGTELAEFPEFPAAWGEFDLREVSEIQIETLTDGTTVYRQQLTAMLWRPRDYNTPDTFIGYRLTGFNEIQRIPVTSASIQVPTVLDFEDLTLRPFKPLIYLPYVSPLLIVGIAAGVGGGSWWLYHQWKKRPRLSEPKLTPPSATEIALYTLDTLNKSDPSQVYEAVAACLRLYIQQQFEVSALTTSELMAALEGRLSEKQINDLNRILSETDLVKFSEVQPNPDVALRLIEVARRWVSELNL